MFNFDKIFPNTTGFTDISLAGFTGSHHEGCSPTGDKHKEDPRAGREEGSGRGFTAAGMPPPDDLHDRLPGV